MSITSSTSDSFGTRSCFTEKLTGEYATLHFDKGSSNRHYCVVRVPGTRTGFIAFGRVGSIKGINLYDWNICLTKIANKRKKGYEDVNPWHPAIKSIWPGILDVVKNRLRVEGYKSISIDYYGNVLTVYASKFEQPLAPDPEPEERAPVLGPDGRPWHEDW